MTRRPIPGKVDNLRQRQRADGSWRVWWEPNASARALGFSPVELDEHRATWSARQARQINEDVKLARAGKSPARSPGGGRTVDALIADYRTSRKFLGKADRTRRGYDANLKIIGEKWGAHPVQDFTKPILHTWYETLYPASGPSQATALVRMFSILFSHAEMLGWRPENSNPAHKLGMETRPPRHRVATWAELDALVDAADTLGHSAMACAILLSCLQGQRQTDVITARVDAFFQAGSGSGPVWSWQLTRSKRQNFGAMPLHDEVRPRVLALIDAARPDQEFLLLDEATGQDYASETIMGDLFRKRWAKIRKRAADAEPTVASLQFRDLRRTFGVWARTGGALKEDVGDVLGNSAALDPHLGETYMPPTFHTAARAVQAVQRNQPKIRRKA